MRFTGCFILLLFSITARSAVPQVKVLIGRSLKDVIVHGTDLQQQNPLQRASRTFAGRQTVNFNCRLGNRRIAMPDRPLLIAAVSSPTGLVGWEDKRYRGELHLVAGSEAAQKGCDLVNLVPMETYISSLLAKEMRADWPLEALKAQAVAARSYAIIKMKNELPEHAQALPWHLESSEKDQVSGSFFDTTPHTDLAARETEGEVLTAPSGATVPGFYHSKCGGRTLRPDQVWSGSVEGYRPVDCPFCHKHGRQSWTKRVTKFEFTSLLRRSLQRYEGVQSKATPESLTFVHDLPGNGEFRVYEGNTQRVLQKNWLRNMLGREALPSNHFRVVDEGSRVRLTGDGFGHGVGMCQMGAYELAKRGYNYREILQHYFPGLSIKKIW